MSQILKKLIAAERQRRLDGKAAELLKSNSGPVNIPGADYLKFAEQYMVNEAGEPMKFNEADRYLFEQFELAQKNGWQLIDLHSRSRRWPRYIAGIDAIDRDGMGTTSNMTIMRQARDGEEYHIIKHEPWEQPFLDAHRQATMLPGVGGTPFKVTLERKFYPTVQVGNLQIPRSDIHFVEQVGDKVVMSFPYPDEAHRQKITFTDQPALWSMFPEIAKQLGKV